MPLAATLAFCTSAQCTHALCTPTLSTPTLRTPMSCTLTLCTTVLSARTSLPLPLPTSCTFLKLSHLPAPPLLLCCPYIIPPPLPPHPAHFLAPFVISCPSSCTVPTYIYSMCTSFFHPAPVSARGPCYLYLW
jgi:hypothetical protein